MSRNALHSDLIGADFAGRVKISALVVAALLSLAAMICFIAFNWQGMDRLIKIALVSAALLITTALAIWAGPHSSARGPLLILPFGLIGLLFALVGQIYQMGADSYGLFQTWALVALVLVAVSRSQLLWLAWLGLVLLTIAFRAQQAPETFWPLFAPWQAVDISFLTLVAGFISCRALLKERFTWLVPPLGAVVLGLLFIALWTARFWLELTLGDEFFVDSQSFDQSRFIVWLCITLVFAGVLGLAIKGKEATAAFLGLFWLASALAVLAIRASREIFWLGADSVEVHILVSGLAIVACFVTASVVMRRWLAANPQERQDLDDENSFLSQASYTAVQGLQGFAGIIGGLVVSAGFVGLMALFFFAPGFQLAIGLAVTLLMAYFSWGHVRKRASLANGEGQQDRLLFYFILFGSANAVVYMALRFDSPLIPAEWAYTLTALAFALLSSVAKVWFPGRVVLYLWAMGVGFLALLQDTAFAEPVVVLAAIIGLVILATRAVKTSGLPEVLWALIIGSAAILWVYMWSRAFAWNLDGIEQTQLVLGMKIVLAALGLAYVWVSLEEQSLPVKLGLSILVTASIALPPLGSFALLLALLALRIKHRLLEVLGWVFFVSALVRSYYALGDTLLEKSFYLGGSALLVLIAFALMTTAQEEQA